MRVQARTAADAILTRAATETRDLAPDELSEHARLVAEEREATDELDALRDQQIAELRATVARRPGALAGSTPGSPVLTRDQPMSDWCQTRGLCRPEQAIRVRTVRGLRRDLDNETAGQTVCQGSPAYLALK
ncbi:hypothetical protein EV384_3777 [Micromonospora kangleipakensis]|uniref:DUF222 domain-containing protein n=1 Tax=Micromonospora kangleipakensis TaxID=1077942 RepID=A0A4Q8BD79_9ACTN|nr:hypothetical protein [Micromonospora kangleipakensis]RZU75245.1 hypothetical protein EV384_3777 [Micromonospora kangleipakensis]